MTDIRYPYQGGVTSTDGQGLVIDSITGQLTLVLDGTSLSKSSSGLKWNDASTQFIDVSSSTTAFRVTQRGTGAALLIEDSTNPDSTPFVIDSNGNVGIGTTSPRVNLELGLDDSSSVIGDNLAQVGLLLRNFNPTTNNWSVIEFDSANGAVAAAIGTQVKDHTNHYGDFVVATRGTGGWGEKLRVTSDGNVGIGASSPTRKLQVNDNSANAAVFINQLGTGPALLVEDSTNPDSTPFVIDANGNVGIGLTTPITKLHISGQSFFDGAITVGATSTPTHKRFRLDRTDPNDNAVLEFYNGAQNMYWFFENQGIGGKGQIRTDSARAIILQSDFTSSLGFVGIGTESPGSKLSVSASTAIGASYCTLAAPSNSLIVQRYVGCGTSNPTSALHLGQTAGVAEAATCLLDEKDTTPASPTSGTQVKMYMKADKIIFQYNDSGTVRYKYLDLTGTTDTWTATTTAP